MEKLSFILLLRRRPRLIRNLFRTLPPPLLAVSEYRRSYVSLDIGGIRLGDCFSKPIEKLDVSYLTRAITNQQPTL